MAASTISTPLTSPAISRLRCGKLAARAGVPSGHSDRIAPCSAICRASALVRGRIDEIRAGADHRDRAADAREPRPDAPRRRCLSRAPTQPSRPPPRIVRAKRSASSSALRRRAAAAHQRDRARMQQLRDAPLYIAAAADRAWSSSAGG